MSISFKVIRAIDGSYNPNLIEYTDPEGTVWTVPLGSGHRFEALFDEWLAEGNSVAQPEPLPVVIPQIVSRFQAKAALLQAGLLDQVEALMASSETPAIYKLAWIEAQDFERSSPTVNILGTTLGLTGDQLDELFVAAAGITA